MTTREYAEITKRHRKWPLGTVVMVKTPNGGLLGHVSRHMRQEGTRAHADVTFLHPVDMGTANGKRYSHPIPFRCMKKVIVLTGLGFWQVELLRLSKDPERNRLQIISANRSLTMYREALFRGVDKKAK